MDFDPLSSSLLGYSFMRAAALLAIRFYQRFISPYKRFACAYRVHMGRCSCSVLGFRAIRRFGLFQGIGVIRKRTYLCGVTHRRFSMPNVRPPRAQRGDCDIGCDFPGDSSCDMPGSMPGRRLFELLDCCNGCDSCDWLNRKSNRHKQDQ
jgi:putative component of membrane protein insertase Oxa1/YidC/SpoIIIJ protein YidD